jgi:enamine deaminase RidA (YjgF/YER057c/UK114 family)
MIVRSGNRGVLHQVSEHGGLLYIGGIAPDDPALGMAGQTRQMLETLDAVLSAHGSDRRHVLMMHVFITDMRLKPEMNRAWAEFFPAEHLPSRITLGIDAIEEGVLIEASAIAARAAGKAGDPPA